MEKLAATDRRERFTHNARLWYTFTGMANKKNKKRQKKYRWIFIILICTAIVILAASYYAAPEKTSAFIYSITGIELTSLKEKNPFVLPDTARESPVPHSAPADAGIEIAGDTVPEQIPRGIEIPVCSKNGSHEIHQYTGFSLCYREEYEQAEWVAYEMNTERLVKAADRSDNFRTDPAISTGSATPADYRGSGYDRGHLAPAADMAFSPEAMKESFYMSNMSPQVPGFNRGVWKNLEAAVRDWTAEFGTLYVISGPVLEKAEYPGIGSQNVAVPEYYYKVVFAPETDSGEPAMIGFILPNEKATAGYTDFAVPVDTVEQRTGLDFFALLDDRLENPLETACNPEIW